MTPKDTRVIRQSLGHEGVRDMDTWHRNSGAKRGAPKGNTNAMRHGIYANRFLSDEEKALFDSIISQLYQDFVFNKSSDFIQVELVAVYFLKLGRAQEAGDYEAAERLDRMIRALSLARTESSPFALTA